jgi:hypothetical protein
MLKRIVWLTVVVGSVVISLLWVMKPETCVACASQTPPPTCTANMSSMTIRKADERRAWWQIFDQRDPRTLNVYLGLNMNNGSTDLPYSYEIIPSGDWQPGWTQPITGTGTLSPGKNNQTIQVTVPYSDTDQGDLRLMAKIDSPCPFSPADASALVRINEQGPTVWPITSRSCPVAGEKPVFKFGLRNPSHKPQTYQVTARAITQFGGDHKPLLTSGGGPAPIPGVHQFPDMTLKPGESREIKINCETFGFCLTGSETRIDLEVKPAPQSPDQFPDAIASSNVTLRDPNADCPTFADWWFIMPPKVFWGMLGTPAALAIAGAGWYFRPQTVTEVRSDQGESRSSKQPSSNGQSVDKDRPDRASGSGGVRRQ